MERQLLDACGDGKVEKVRSLLQNPQLNVNWQNIFGQTPFLIACWNRHIEIVKLLLNGNRVDVNQAMNGVAHHFILLVKKDTWKL